jgi:hypothetical protein
MIIAAFPAHMTCPRRRLPGDALLHAAIQIPPYAKSFSRMPYPPFVLCTQPPSILCISQASASADLSISAPASSVRYFPLWIPSG